MNLKHTTLLAGACTAACGAAAIVIAKKSGPIHTLDLFTTTTATGLVLPGPIAILAIGLFLIFVAAIIPRR